LRYGLSCHVAAAALIAGPLGPLLISDPHERFVDSVALLFAAVGVQCLLGGLGPGCSPSFSLFWQSITSLRLVDM